MLIVVALLLMPISPWRNGSGGFIYLDSEFHYKLSLNKKMFFHSVSCWYRICKHNVHTIRINSLFEIFNYLQQRWKHTAHSDELFWQYVSNMAIILDYKITGFTSHLIQAYIHICENIWTLTKPSYAGKGS